MASSLTQAQHNYAMAEQLYNMLSTSGMEDRDISSVALLICAAAINSACKGIEESDVKREALIALSVKSLGNLSRIPDVK